MSIKNNQLFQNKKVYQIKIKIEKQLKWKTMEKEKIFSKSVKNCLSHHIISNSLKLNLKMKNILK